MSEPSQDWMDFITRQITHDQLVERVRRAHDPFKCPRTGTWHNFHQGPPDKDGRGGHYCLNCGYNCAYRLFTEDERGTYTMAAKAWAAKQGRPRKATT